MDGEQYVTMDGGRAAAARGGLTREQALSRAAALCGSGERCSSQVMEKLSSWGVEGDDAAYVMGRLAAERFVDDERFCRAYCHDKFRYNRWGRVKLRQMLRRLRLESGAIEAGLAEIPEAEYRQALCEALRQKDRTLREEDACRRKGKLVRHLLSRGFEAELVLDAVDDFLGL